MRRIGRPTTTCRVTGFSLVELLVVIAMLGIVAAMAFPVTNSTLDSLRLRAAARDVERELQAARLKAVSTRQPMRVRFNCPATGQFRMVELIGTPAAPASADSAADRCSDSLYPFQTNAANRLVRPRNDGPVRTLQRGTAFTDSRTIEFWPDGTAHIDGGPPWPVISSASPVTITVTRRGVAKNITVNGLGKIQVQ